MLFPTKIVAGVCAVGAVCGAAWWFVASGPDTVPSAIDAAPALVEGVDPGPVASQDGAGALVAGGGVAPSAPAAKPVLSFPRAGMPALDVFGPCYDDTRGNDVLITSNPKAATDCFVLRNGGRDMIDLSGRGGSQPVYIRISGKEQSSQTLVLPDADNVIEVDGFFEMRISGVRGRENILALPALARSDIGMFQEDLDVVIRTNSGTIRLVRQAEGDGLNGIVSRILLRGGDVVERSQIRVQATVGQTTDGNDTIMDTDNDDSIFPKLGDDTITLRGGKNLILYEGGNKTISSFGDQPAVNSIHFSISRSEVVIMPSEDGRDVILETPQGRLLLALQMFHPIDHPRLPIHGLVFSDLKLDAAGIRFAAEMHQESKSSVDQEDRARLRN
jgi:Ca2+-binding RTX toxin-like protein